MKNFKLIIFLFTGLLVLNTASIAQAQNNTISSPEAFISLSSNSALKSTIDTSEVLAFTIIYPKFNTNLVYISEYEVINFIGKLHNIENIQSVLLNDKEIEFSKDGLFGEMLNLELGKNKLTLRLIFSDGSVKETDLMINCVSRDALDNKGTTGNLHP